MDTKNILYYCTNYSTLELDCELESLTDEAKLIVEWLSLEAYTDQFQYLFDFIIITDFTTLLPPTYNYSLLDT